MHKLKQLYYFVVLLPTLSFGQTNIRENLKYSFTRIGIEQGLSQSTVLSILQDNKGYLWFGTATGLNRYDGYEFITYINDVNDSLSISNNVIRSLHEDRNGYLWIGTSKGILNKFDPKTETFTHYDIANSSDWYSKSDEEFYTYPINFSRNQNSTITTIAEDIDGNLWLGTWGKGIVKFNPKTNVRKYFYHFRNKKNSLSSNKIVKILIDSDDIMWVGTFGGGLNRITFDPNANGNIKIDAFKNKNKYYFGDRITSIFEDSENKIWIGTYENGISAFDQTEKLKNPNELISNKIISNIESLSGSNILNVMSIIEDQNLNIWIGTYGDGLYSYSKLTADFDHIVSETSNPNSLSENEVQSLYVDNSGILWIGTQLGGGINKLELGVNRFSTIPVMTEENKSLNDNIVWSICEDDDKNIWIGTYRGGLNKWDKEKNEFTYYKKDKNLAGNHIRSIERDKHGNLWIGSYSGGLSFYNKNNNSFKNFSKESSKYKSLNANQIQSLYNDGDSILWIGTFGGGLNKLDLELFYNTGNAEFLNFTYNPIDPNSISDNRIYAIIKDSKNILWVGTHGGGLNRYIEESKTFKQYKSDPDQKNTLSDNRIMSLQETSNGNLLVGTFGGGLDHFIVNKNKFESLNETILLNCSDIYGIIKDSTNGFWISTNNGIFKIEKDLKSFRQYDLSDGLQSLEFSGGAYFKGHDGICYFGGINGMNYFDPSKIKLNDYVPPVVISRIKVFDTPIKGEKDKLVFGRDENYFSFEFASLDYKNSKKNKYQYILEGLDKKWSFTDAKDRRVYYTNLLPGDYTFRVKGTNNDGIWSPSEAKVDITILAPFWMRWWFILSVILLIAGLIAFYIRQRIKYLLEVEALKSNIAADLHDNVGAGLTEISILSELATNEIENPNIATKHIGQISELSRHLVESMSDIVWVVNPNVDSLYDLIVRLKDMYGELLADLGIKLQTSNLENLNNIKLPMDYRQNLYLILKESLNNSIKHSKCNNIDLVVYGLKNKLIVKIIDNGIGFDINSVSLGNGLQNIKERGQKMGGTLNIFSGNGNGTKIEFEGRI